MNTRQWFITPLAVLLCISTAVAPRLSSAETAPTPRPSASAPPLGLNAGQCDAVCTEYRKQTKDSGAIEMACGKEPSPDKDPTEVKNTNETFKTFDDCKSAMQAKWGQVGEQCNSIFLFDEGKQDEQIGAAVYTAATAVCLLACLSDKSVILKAYAQGLVIACYAVGAAATVTDAAMQIKLAVNGNSYSNWANNSLGIAAMLGSTSAPVASALGNDICYTMGIMAVVAALKWGNMALYGSNKGPVCKKIEEMGGFGQLAITSPGSSGSGGLGSFGNGSGGGTSGSGGKSAGQAGNKIDKIPENPATFPEGISSAASAGPIGKLFNNLPNKDQIPGALKDATGLSVKDIARKLENQGPGSILAGLDGVPSDLGAKLSELDKFAREGKITADGLGGGYSGGGSGGGGAPKANGDANPFASLFAPKDSGGGPAKKDLVFTGALTDNDIWHSKFKGSIFEIVSQKLDRSRARIIELEWASPMNRALAGQKK